MPATPEPPPAGRNDYDRRSLSEVHRTVQVPLNASWIRRMLAFAGPAYLVSVGYMDPGNWATDLAGGARFGYKLVWVLIMSNLMAVLLQTLSARLGVVTGKDLAQACRDFYPRVMAYPLWFLCEIAIIACDLAEVLGAAIGLYLLFGLPLLWGVMLTGLDVLLLLALGRLGMRRMEALIIVLVATIGVCFAIEMLLSKPSIAGILSGVIPRGDDGRPSLFARGSDGSLQVLGLNRESLYVAMGILGATVMPHNLYLHSALVQSRAVEQSTEGKRQACRMNLVDSVVALNCALFVNGAILVLAAAVFHQSGHAEVAKLEDAHRLLAPLLGTSVASVAFALALLCSGQSSTITGTLAGQIVMEGFLHIRIQPWLRRMISRGLAIIPAVLFIALRGPGSVDDLLVLSQVVLSMQLAFAVIPLIAFTSDRQKMGDFVNPKWVITLAVLAATIIVGLNANLVVQSIGAWMQSTREPWIQIPVIVLVSLVGVLLMYVIGEPLARRFMPKRSPRLEPAWVPVAAGSGPVRESAGRDIVAQKPSRLPEGPPRKLAIALELGSADAAVLEHVRSNFAVPGAELTLLHVVESAAGRYLGPESMDQETRADLAALEKLAAELRATGATVNVALGYGDPKTELARLVKEVAPDLLVTGSHGHGGIQDVIYGATVSGLRHRVSCPVLTVPSGGPPRS